MSPTETDLETRLRADLRARQDDVPPAPADLADLVRRRHRSQRRTQALTLVAAAAVVALVTGATNLLAGPRTGSQDAAEAPGRTAEPTILERPTRGSLADDAEWLSGVRRLDWQIPTELFGEIPDPPANERHVAFAGDVPGGRVALVVGEQDGRVGAAWFTGPTGADPAEMELAVSPSPVPRHGPLALWQSATLHARDGVLVLVTEPGDAVDLAAPPVVASNGEETRARVDLPVVDGVVATRVEGAWSMGRELRVRDAGAVPRVVGPALSFPGQASPPTAREAAPPDQVVVDDLVAEVLADYDLTAEQSRPTVLARGTAYQGERVLLVGLTFPSGATGVWLLTADQAGEGWSGGLARLPHASAGTPLEERLVAVPVDGSHLALHGPDRAVRADVVTADDRVLGSVPLTDGAFIGEVPGGSFAPSTDGAAGVRLVDAAGDVVATGFIERVVTE